MTSVEIVNGLTLVSELISGVGILIIIFGVLNALYRIVKIEAINKKRFHAYEHTKRVLIQKIIFALDFFVAADLIKLAIVTKPEQIFSIALIVAIRTVLSWSLSREVHLHKE
jgi:uncharacterized membrane protein